MLKIIAKQIDKRKWMAKASLTGRGISVKAQQWVSGPTKTAALKKLSTVLKNESKLNQAAAYRVAMCRMMTSQAIAKEKSCTPTQIEP